MQIDWGQATTVAAVGFVTVFVVLGVLAAVLYGASGVIARISARGGASGQTERKEK